MSNKVYSMDGEYWTKDFSYVYDQCVDCFDDSDGDDCYCTYYEGTPANIDLNNFIYIDNVVGQLDDWLYEDLGETYDNDFSNLPKEVKQELKDILVTFFRKHTKVESYYTVKNVAEKKFTKSDVE
jgi:hypothetical protein